MSTKRTNQSTAKRRRVDLTLAQKKAICQHKKDNPKLSQPALQHYVSEQFSVSIGRSTISNILSNSDKWLAVSTHHQNERRDRPSLLVDLENSLSKWEQFANDPKVDGTVSDLMLTEKAQQIGEKLGLTDFTYSRGWLQKFRSRYGIKKTLKHGESGSLDPALFDAARAKLQTELEPFELCDFYNLDPTSDVFWPTPTRSRF